MTNHPNRNKRWEICTKTSSGDELVVMRARGAEEAAEMARGYQSLFPLNAVWIRDSKAK